RTVYINSNETVCTMSNKLSGKEFLDIYDSFSDRDKKIALRISIDDLMKTSTIIKYGITITHKMLEYKLLHGKWTAVVSLMHISRDYDYLIEMLDVETIMLAPSY